MELSKIINMKNNNMFERILSYFDKFHTKAIERAVDSKDYSEISKLDFFRNMDELTIQKYGQIILNNEIEIFSFYRAQGIEDESAEVLLEKIKNGVNPTGGNLGDLYALIERNDEKTQIIEDLVKFISNKVKQNDLSHYGLIDSYEYKKFLYSFAFNLQSNHSAGALSSSETRTWQEIENETTTINNFAISLKPVLEAIIFYKKLNPELDVVAMVTRALVCPVFSKVCYCCGRPYFLQLSFKNWAITEAPYKNNILRIKDCVMKKGEKFEFGSKITVSSGRLTIIGRPNFSLNHVDFDKRVHEFSKLAKVPVFRNGENVISSRLNAQVCAELLNVASMVTIQDMGIVKKDGNTINICKPTDSEDDDRVFSTYPLVLVSDSAVLEKLEKVKSDDDEVVVTELEVENGTYFVAIEDFVKDGEPFLKIQKISDSVEKEVLSDEDALKQVGIIEQSRYEKMLQVRIGSRGSRFM